MTKRIAWLALLALGFAFEAYSAPAAFPLNPDPKITPGSLCDHPGFYSYKEQVARCARDVDSELKVEIIRVYDHTFGYAIEKMKRVLFKIDHFIPLCMGGSNRPDNLWPQHESVYSVTDPIEQRLCQKMAEGRLRQAEAVAIIRRAKADLNEARRVLSDLN